LVLGLVGCEAATKDNRFVTQETCPESTLGGPTTAGDLLAVRDHFPHTQPDLLPTNSATDDLARAIDQIGRLNYLAASRTLVRLEGRLILANDLDRAAEAAFWAAFCDEKIDLRDQAAVEYGRVIERYPTSPQARTAAARLNRLRPPNIRVVPPS
jgi:hypothetical protein